MLAYRSIRVVILLCVSNSKRSLAPILTPLLTQTASLLSVLRDEQQEYKKVLLQPHKPHTHISLKLCLTPAWCTKHGFGPELERALDSTAVMMEGGDRQYYMNDGFFSDL